MNARRRKNRQAGFSLVELAISILILVVLMGAIFSQINRVTKVSHRESLSTDLVQENRDFVDLFVRDMHMAGYPVSLMYGASPTPACTPLPSCAHSIAVGIVYASPTELRLEGDVYGDGNVYSVQYKYFQTDPNVPPDPNCPCLRRSAVLKQDGDPVSGQATPKYYTEVQHVIDPTGMSQSLFTYFEADGTVVDPGTGIDFENNIATVQRIDAVKVNLNVRSSQVDVQTGQSVVHSLASIAELEN